MGTSDEERDPAKTLEKLGETEDQDCMVTRPLGHNARCRWSSDS